MKRIFLLFLISSVFVMCKSKALHTSSPEEEKKDAIEHSKNDDMYYVEDVRNDFRSVSEQTKNKFLEGYKATEKQYSILFFTQGFTGEQIHVKNDKGSVFKGSVITNKKTGLAKNMRILNTSTNSIYDQATKKTIFIDTKMASQYKFVYVMKDLSNKEKPYKITYSNLLRPEQ